MKIKTQDAFTSDIAKAPIQQLAPLTRQLAMKNRTARASGTRWATEMLGEIDCFATEGEHKGKIKEEDDKLSMRAGSTWARVATFWTGKTDDRMCQLCLEEEEIADHVWKCRCLKEKTKELDKELAEIDPEKFTNSMRIWGCSSDGWSHEVDILGSRAGRKLEQRNEEDDGMLLKEAGRNGQRDD